MRRFLVSVAGRMRTPFRSYSVLLVTTTASPAKVEEIETRLRFVSSHLKVAPEIIRTNRATPLSYLRSAAVAYANSDAAPGLMTKHLPWVVDLDYEHNPNDGWELMRLSAELAALTDNRNTMIDISRARFKERVEELKTKGSKPVYLFGTGPSLKFAADRSFSDGITIVCNTIVRDPALWHQLDPAFFVAGDAIYHFDSTAHARAFRKDALNRLKESNGQTLFVYPAHFDTIVRSEFHDVESILVPIPCGEHTDISVDLTEHFQLPTVENVLAMLLLPLGCTLGNDVRLWGFDGRAPADAGFWSNSAEHAYPELMQSIRDAHPAFFDDKIPKGDEAQYVNKVHGDFLEERLTNAEDRGFRFQMLHPTWTPTLLKRYRQDSP